MYIHIRPRLIAFCSAKPRQSYSCSPYIYIRTTRIAAKPCKTVQNELSVQSVYTHTDETNSILLPKAVQKKLSPRRVFFYFFSTQPQCLAPAGQSWAEAGSGVRNWSSPGDWGRATGFRPQGRGVLLDCAWTRKPDCEEARLLAGLPEVLLPVRSVKC